MVYNRVFYEENCLSSSVSAADMLSVTTHTNANGKPHPHLYHLSGTDTAPMYLGSISFYFLLML